LLKGKDLPKLLPWEECHDAAFAAAKASLAAAVPLVHLLPDMLLAFATNVSDTHVGGVLQQKVRGHWQPLGFFSRRLSATEANYSTFERELLAAQAAINHFLPQVEGRQFQLWTDHKPLVAAMTIVTPPALGRQQRHLAFIAEDTCNVRHTLKAQEIVEKVERGMMDGAEDEAKSAKEAPDVLSIYPSLTELRRRESRYYF
jgi:RNase H-like domain found in reverse transcriptase